MRSCWSLWVWWSLGVSVLGQTDIHSNPYPGILLAPSWPTFGIAAYFVADGGTTASEVCAMGSGSNTECNAFQPAIASAIGFALIDHLYNTTNQSAYAVGDPNSPDMPLKKRTSKFNPLLNIFGYNLTEVSPDSNVLQSRHDGSVVTFSATSKGDLPYRLDLHERKPRSGSVTIRAAKTMYRRADNNTYIRPNAQVQSLHSSSGPGFKVTYTNYNDAYEPDSLNPASIVRLANSISADWALRAENNPDGSRYLGVFAQGTKMITALEIIPEIRGYGIEHEDPNAVCGPLDAFACGYDKECYDKCLELGRIPNKSCTPLSRGASITSSPSPVTITASSETQSSIDLATITLTLPQAEVSKYLSRQEIYSVYDSTMTN